MFRLVAAVLLVSAAVAVDQCNKYPNCAVCVANPLCGWCSTKVVYQNGAPGFQCAGFNSNSSNPFVCNGIYSTKQCQRGYVCNTSTYTCDLTTPGNGEPKADCLANCSTVGKTYVCNNKTMTCEQATPGQGTSFQVCEENCHATHSPASNSPHSNSPHSQSPASHSPASHSPHSNGPTAAPTVKPTLAPTYTCNVSTFTCQQAQPGQGSSLPVCQSQCKPSNHTPATLIGLWRAFDIQNDAAIEEIDYDLRQDGEVKIYAAGVTTSCSVESVGPTQVWFTKCTGGSVTEYKCVYEASNTMPETYEAMIGCNTAGAAPATVTAAMSAGASTFVSFMSRCVPDGYCHFHFGPSNSSSSSAHAVHQQEAFEVVGLKSLVRAGSRAGIHVNGASDPCQQYGSSCATCITHQYCGWCSTNVTYQGGVAGSQCAGVNPDPKKHVPFTCDGMYSTEMCLPGWVCNVANQTCVPTTPGNGVPKADCVASCKSKPGPPTNIVGKYRGLIINQNYTFGEVTANFQQNGTVVFQLNSKPLFTANVRHQAANIIFDVTEGEQTGHTLIGIFSQTQNEIVTYMTLTMGVIEPANYKAGMVPPNEEFILAECSSSSCKF